MCGGQGDWDKPGKVSRLTTYCEKVLICCSLFVRWTPEEFDHIRDKFRDLAHQFGYSPLFDEFVKHRNDPTSTEAQTAFRRALWPELDHLAHPSEPYCTSLLSVEWNWNNAI